MIVCAMICSTVLALAGMAYRFAMRGRETRLADHANVLKNHALALERHEQTLALLSRKGTHKALGA